LHEICAKKVRSKMKATKWATPKVVSSKRHASSSHKLIFDILVLIDHLVLF